MHSTKSEILALLKRNGGATVDDLASSLGLAPMTVRQHLTALERDSLVGAEEVRRRTGRPHFRYALTDNGHRSIAEGYDRLLLLLVEEAGLTDNVNGSDSPAARRARLFERAATALADRYLGELLALQAQARVERAVALLRSHGGFAEWHADGDAIELRDFGCVYRASVGLDGPCAWHEAFLARIFGVDVRPADSPAVCADCCRYTITIVAPLPAASPQDEHS